MPERRRAACAALCEARGREVVAAEEDIDVSGFSRGLDRPGPQRLLTRLAELDVILFCKIDRLARSTVGFAEIMRLAEYQSVALASATEPLGRTSSTGRAMAKLIAVFAELESGTTGMRVSSAHEHLRREGRYTGGRVPYGYMVVPDPNGAGKALAVNEASLPPWPHSRRTTGERGDFTSHAADGGMFWLARKKLSGS
ncbi:recombinase family protein [Streptomyces sp. NPDC097107]|uniref:recombinase family protein n=1 Tax=Streptomyces sp. NPDC097107 TaxID=3366089 RepID=UPI003827C8B3